MSITPAIDGRQAPQRIRSRHCGMVRLHQDPQMRNCASGNPWVPGSMLRDRPAMTGPSSAAKTNRPVNARRWCGVNNYFPLMAWLKF